jgi:hypothetical protein
MLRIYTKKRGGDLKEKQYLEEQGAGLKPIGGTAARTTQRF